MSKLPTSGHPTPEALEAAAAGDHEDRVTRGHLERCAQCRQEVEELRQLLDLLAAASGLPEPPAWFRSRALMAIRRRRERGSVFTGFLRLLHDSLLAPAPSPVRGPAVSGRQLLIAGPGIELDLRLAPPDEGAPGRVTGQIHLKAPERPEPATDIEVEIADRRGLRTSAKPDRFGIFSITGHFDPPLIVTVRSHHWIEEAFVPEPPI